MEDSANKNKTYHITTFGCQMNASDSERVAAVAENLGYKSTDDFNSADLLIINSCSIRQKAEDRVMGMGKKVKDLKENRSRTTVVLTGCMAKREDRSKSPFEAGSKGDVGDKTSLDSSSHSLQMKNESQNSHENNLKKLMPWLDHIVEIKEIHKLGDFLGIEKNIEVEEYLSVKPKSNKSFFQYIPISTGCNKFCTFCIVPFSRGREIYRPFGEIMDELKNALENGAREITLLGQNVNSWRGYKPHPNPLPGSGPGQALKVEGNKSLLLLGEDRDEGSEIKNIPMIMGGDKTSLDSSNHSLQREIKSKYIESKDPHRLLKKEMPEDMMDFSDLLEEIGTYLDQWIKTSPQPSSWIRSRTGSQSRGRKVWLKFTSSHPYDIDEKLVEVINKHSSLANQFHFAMQSGSNSVLRRMNRHYTIEDFAKKCEMIRSSIPEVGISTDVIVGFCGESEEEFFETVDIIKNLKFDQAFISEYSTRKGTVAARVYKDTVENSVKAQRKVILNDILGQGNLERNKLMLGKIYDVLVYKKNRHGFVGRTENNKDVILKITNDELSSFVKTTADRRMTNNNLIGEFVKVKSPILRIGV